MRRSPGWLVFAALAAGCHSGTATPPREISPSQGPRVEIAARVIDAGEVDNTRSYERSFPITNTGDAPLHLTLSRRSCSCGEIAVPDAIGPGGTGAVVFRWKPPPAASGPTTLAAEIDTDDPQTPSLRLEVRSVAKPRVRIAPHDLAFLDLGPVRRGSPAGRTLTVYSPTLEAFGLEATVNDPALRVSVEPMPAGTEVESIRARSAYRVLVRTADTLPPGYIRDDLVLTVTPPGESPHRLLVPVYAAAENPAFLVTPEEIAFTKPRVADADAKTVRVQFTVPADSDTLEVVGVEPRFLHVSPPTRRGRGLWEFRVELPENHPDAARFQPDHFFEGRILLRSSAVKGTVPVRVKWVPPEGG